MFEQMSHRFIITIYVLCNLHNVFGEISTGLIYYNIISNGSNNVHGNITYHHINITTIYSLY